MDLTLVCWRCGMEQKDLLLPMSRRAECPECRAELHVCRMCVYYDTRVAKDCRETVADEVQDKTRANFCGYFEPRADAFRAMGNEGARARSDLEALFGTPSENRMDRGSPGTHLESGVDAGSPGSATGRDDPRSSARSALEDLFGGKS